MTTRQITQASPLGAWTDDENDVISTAYLRNLEQEQDGEKYNKAAARRAGLAAMAATRDDGRARSAGSWEMKCCNISAVMRAAGLPWVNGYKPLGHGQAKPIAAAIVRAMLANGWPDEDITRAEKLAK